MGAKELRQGAKSVVCGCFCGKKAILGKTPSSGRFACNFVKRERLDICMEIYFRKLGRFWVTFVQQTPLSKNAFNNFLVVTFLVGFAGPIICNLQSIFWFGLILSKQHLCQQIFNPFWFFGCFCRPYYLQPVGKRGRPSRQRWVQFRPQKKSL